MSPDLNSLPPSPSPSTTPQTRISANEPPRAMSQSPAASHTPPHSLTAAATMNAGLQNEERRTSSGSMRREIERSRRRSSIRLNLGLNDPSLPAPGEMASPSRTRAPWPQPHSPHHERAPSLGELHQDFEYESEGQVNRLLNMIRQQQAHIQQLHNNPPTSAVDDSTPTSERSLNLPQQASQPTMSPLPSAAAPRSRSPYAMNHGTISRHSSMADRSRGSSHTGSPALRPSSGYGFGPHDSNDFLPGAAVPTRDESAFYQAETQMLTRENQMLKLRIRELERQLSDLNPTSPITHSPLTSSNLHSSPPVSRRQTLANVQSNSDSNNAQNSGT